MPPELPAVVAERFVRVGHLVGVFALLNSSTARLNSVQKLTGKALFHGVLVAGAGELQIRFESRFSLRTELGSIVHHVLNKDIIIQDLLNFIVAADDGAAAGQVPARRGER